MKYAFIDPANKAGICIVENGNIIDHFLLRKKGAKGKWTDGINDFENEFLAWKFVVRCVDCVICEEGFGRFATAIKSQAGYRRYIQCICDMFTNDLSTEKKFRTVNVSEWRRVISEEYHISWPRKSVLCKELSQKLVKQHFGLEVTADESDAILLFVACKRMGMVE